MTKKYIGSLTFKWKQKKKEISVHLLIKKERERERCRDVLNWNVKSGELVVIGK